MFSPRGPRQQMPRVNSVGRMRGGRLSAPRGGQLLTTTAFAFLLLFVFAIPLENALVLPGVGTFGRLVGLAAFAVGIFAVIEKGQLRSPLPVHLVCRLLLEKKKSCERISSGLLCTAWAPRCS